MLNQVLSPARWYRPGGIPRHTQTLQRWPTLGAKAVRRKLAVSRLSSKKEGYLCQKELAWYLRPSVDLAAVRYVPDQLEEGLHCRPWIAQQAAAVACVWSAEASISREEVARAKFSSTRVAQKFNHTHLDQYISTASLVDAGEEGV